MFRYDISQKIRTLAYVNFVAGILITVAIIIVCFKNGADLNELKRNSGEWLIWTGVIGGGFSVLVTLIVSFIIAAIGDISESLETMVYYLKSQNSMVSSISSWKCKECGADNEGNSIVCKTCGTYK
ncbi:hypothetical protein ES1_17430 [[Eubacterium] siraeum V10Sc8a]|uniref:RanBP2-type domain-containing protein n=1 Tax=[Eubacterium] siraeum V10Sc8a TaxID=717961 RepID=D4MLN8_9FIRM|nr:hypothetical protein ES1_17430 [[Eubacterium] siraeum V10Sc8a]